MLATSPIRSRFPVTRRCSKQGRLRSGPTSPEKEFDSWPIAVGGGRRQIQQFIFTSLPGTIGSTWQGSINGGQNYSHEILIDGITLGRMDLAGGANSEFSPSAESISEFKLQTGTVSAQYSGTQTSVANFATKSGTNELHGSAYYYGQNDALRANNFNSNAAGVARQPYKQSNYGYSVGGPVYIPKVYDGRNKSFFFHNMERTTQKDYSQTLLTQLPTTDFKRGDFSRLLSPGFTGNANSGSAVGTDAARTAASSSAPSTIPPVRDRSATAGCATSSPVTSSRRAVGARCPRRSSNSLRLTTPYSIRC